MYKLIIALVALAAFVGGFFILNSYIYNEKQAEVIETDISEREVFLNQFEDQSIGLVFDYPDGPDGYVIDDMSDFVGEESQGIEVVKAYRLMNAEEKIELENSEVGREGPPTIQLMVFKNELNQSASMWVDAFPSFSNIELLIGEPDRDAVVGGANAVRYTTDGLYVTDNVVVAHDDYLYHFSVGYLEPDSVIHQDFRGVIDSIRFVPSAGIEANAKIDIKVACESALAYMLFQTGEQAEQFVTECIAGEHPDVIERYIESLNADGAAI